MTTVSNAADRERLSTDAATDAAAATDTVDVPDWLAAMRPTPPPVVPEPGVPVAVTAAPPRAATPPSRHTEPVPALLAEDDLPAWLTRLATESPPPSPPAPPAGAGGVPAWIAPAGAAPAAPALTAPEAPPPVWGARATTAAPTESAGAAIFASLASTPVAIEPDEPLAAATPAASTPRPIPWWWFAVAAAVVLLLVIVVALLPR